MFIIINSTQLRSSAVRIWSAKTKPNSEKYLEITVYSGNFRRILMISWLSVVHGSSIRSRRCRQRKRNALGLKDMRKKIITTAEPRESVPYLSGCRIYSSGEKCFINDSRCRCYNFGCYNRHLLWGHFASNRFMVDHILPTRISLVMKNYVIVFTFNSYSFPRHQRLSSSPAMLIFGLESSNWSYKVTSSAPCFPLSPSKEYVPISPALSTNDCWVGIRHFLTEHLLDSLKWKLWIALVGGWTTKNSSIGQPDLSSWIGWLIGFRILQKWRTEFVHEYARNVEACWVVTGNSGL